MLRKSHKNSKSNNKLTKNYFSAVSYLVFLHILFSFNDLIRRCVIYYSYFVVVVVFFEVKKKKRNIHAWVRECVAFYYYYYTTHSLTIGKGFMG